MQGSTSSTRSPAGTSVLFQSCTEISLVWLHYPECTGYALTPFYNSLDAEAEKIVDRLIETRLKHCTVISVVHKIDSALGFQKVAVMDQGRIVEFDDPQVLMARSSKFRELYDAEHPASI